MPIFVSYSHHDAEFVDRLAVQLVSHKARVWIDRWELNVGDSLIDRIQAALQDASALVVVLSKASIASEWCKKEFSAGLLRELEERRIIVLPVLLEDCEVPIFLRGKMYADFRTNFDDGLRTILDAVARVTSEGRGRLDKPGWHTDWALDWGQPHGLFVMRVTSVEQGADKPYCVLTEIEITGDEKFTARYQAFQAEGLDWVERHSILEMVATCFEKAPLGTHQLVIDDEFPKVRLMKGGDLILGLKFDLQVTIRRLGEDNGKAVFFDYGAQFRQISDQSQRTVRLPSKEEQEKILQLLETFR